MPSDPIREALRRLICSRHGGWCSALDQLDRYEAEYGEAIPDDSERTMYALAGDLRFARTALNAEPPADLAELADEIERDADASIWASSEWADRLRAYRPAPALSEEDAARLCRLADELEYDYGDEAAEETDLLRSIAAKLGGEGE